MRLRTLVVLTGVACSSLVIVFGISLLTSSTAAGILFGGLLAILGAGMLADSMARL